MTWADLKEKAESFIEKLRPAQRSKERRDGLEIGAAAVLSGTAPYLPVASGPLPLPQTCRADSPSTGWDTVNTHHSFAYLKGGL